MLQRNLVYTGVTREEEHCTPKSVTPKPLREHHTEADGVIGAARPTLRFDDLASERVESLAAKPS